jgi:hypothetical protein
MQSTPDPIITNFEVFSGQAKEKMLTHRSSLKANTFNRMWQFQKAFSDIIDLTRQLLLKQHRSFAINNAKCTGSQ